MIPVTKPYLPPIEEYYKHLEGIWQRNHLTNRGKLVLDLEEKLKKYLSVNNILITNNGTIPLQIALKLLGNGGEIITTPFSYVATTASIIWENCQPVFVDIDPSYLTIDETKIEQAITEKTTCILATHVFGNPCNVEEIERIANKHNLKVIYDAAHCFGVKYKGKSIFEYGDLSTCSFHATKLFHTAEGGAIFCKNTELFQKVFYSHNFGHDGPENFHGLGINAKISELQCAMGLTVLPHIESILDQRKLMISLYEQYLQNLNIVKLVLRLETDWNFSYYPIIFESEDVLLKVIEALNKESIYPRRYFYPSLNKIAQIVRYKEMPIAEDIASRILCLPLYNTLELNEIEKISKIISIHTNSN